MATSTNSAEAMADIIGHIGDPRPRERTSGEGPR
jgi:hypothetical protein